LTAKPLTRKILKITGIIVGSLLILLTAFHFWIVNHAEEIIQDLVESKSNGNIKLEVSNFKFNWFSKKMELEDAVFYTTDSVTAGTTYRFAVKNIKLKVKGVFPLIFEKKVLIDKLSLDSPDILVTRLRASRDSTRGEKSSIPQEMGRIYKSIQDAMKVLEVKKFEIENATFTLVNKMDPDQLPVQIGKIDFHIDNFKIDTSQLTGKEKIFFSDNIVLKSRDQDVLFPDGRHRLSYRKFRINIEKRIVVFDSCTIAALKTGNNSTGFSIYFDALQLTNINFDTLYRSEVIKADSVYCINPTFKLIVDLDKRKSKGAKAPKLDEIIRQLTGDLLLNFVVVNNASFDINTIRNGKPSSFTSNKNNFEIQGLTIDNDAARPFRVEKFGMAIRNYENFLRDSLYALQFDSILVNNDKIYLNNFSFQQRVKGNPVNSFKVPKFQLTGLSWDDLLFEQKLTAQQAVLYDPVIHYTEEPNKNTGLQQKRNLFEALADINQVFMLEDLSIRNGNIEMHLNGGIDMNLKDATLSVESRSLLGSSQLSGIRRSVNHLDFSQGKFRINDMLLQMDSIIYTGNNSKLNAGRVLVKNDDTSIDATASAVRMDEIFINELTGDVTIAGINWDKANINLAAIQKKRTGKGTSFISLTDIKGMNTTVQYASAGKSVSGHINHLSAIAFLLKPGEKPIIAGLQLSGNNLKAADANSEVSIESVDIADHRKALLNNISFKKKSSADTIIALIPQLSFIPDIQAAIAGEINAREMKITKPTISIWLNKKEESSIVKDLSLPVGIIDQLKIEQPEIHFRQQTEDGFVKLDWYGKRTGNNYLLLDEVIAGKSFINARQLSVLLNSFILENEKGKLFDAGKGEITARLQDISYRQLSDSGIHWQAGIYLLNGKNFRVDSLGKKAGSLIIETVQLKDLALQSGSLSSVRKLIEQNTRFRLDRITGSYANSDNVFNWYNAGYDRSNRYFTLDSFRYSPADDREAFVKKHPYQTDFVQATTGAVSIGPFDLEKYLRDTIVNIGTVKIDSVRFSDYRDNRPPFKTGVIKPLMTARIKSIPFKISVDSVLLNNAYAVYTEHNPKTDQAGTIPVTRMTLRVFPFRNYDLIEKDSLRIQANGYLFDSVWVRLRLRESYLDSLAGFLMTARLKPADMRILNPVLVPLVSARLKSGYLDTMSMRVHGNEYYAYGDMLMLYHNLKAEIILTKNKKKRKFLTGLLNFAANSFLIKNKNTKRTGKIFYLRNRERSSLNYLIKMVISGASTSTGVKGNRKLIRHYKKEVRQRNLPPVDYD